MIILAAVFMVVAGLAVSFGVLAFADYIGKGEPHA